MARLIILLSFVLAGCTGLNEFSSHLTKSQAEAVIDRAREMVLESTTVKGAQEIEFIKNTKPSLSYYFLAKPFADYFVHWQVNDEEFILVYGRGNLLVLEGASLSAVAVIPRNLALNHRFRKRRR